MGRDGKVEAGKATTLHFGGKGKVGTMPGNGPHPRAVAPIPAAGKGGSGGKRRHGVLRPASIIPIALALVLLGGAGAGAMWWTQWRQIAITVNGEEVKVHPEQTLGQAIEANGYFGVKAGRLMSVTGKVIKEDGGERFAVSRGDKPITFSKVASMPLAEGDSFTVSNGADVTESSHEETRKVEPAVKDEGVGAVQFVSQWGHAGEKRVTVGDTSGETVDKEVITPAQDMVVTHRNPKPQDGKKYMALTFDDGPSDTYSPQILDILKQKGVHATFYNLGEETKARSALSKRAVDEGHEVASHTNTHQYLPKLDRDALRSEISSALTTLKDATGVSARMIRAPYGAFTATEWGRSADLISCNVLWNIDTEDWKRPGADTIKSTVLDHARNGAIVLMHDGGGNRSQDVEALPGIIDGLRAQGYELVTVSELMRLDGGFPNEVVDGTVTMPDGAELPES